METFLGLGYVENLMDRSGQLQIDFHRPLESDKVSKILKTIKDDSKTTRRIKIKPSVSIAYLGNI